jgi:hypothetical protein
MFWISFRPTSSVNGSSQYHLMNRPNKTIQTIKRADFSSNDFSALIKLSPALIDLKTASRIGYHSVANNTSKERGQEKPPFSLTQTKRHSDLSPDPNLPNTKEAEVPK